MTHTTPTTTPHFFISESFGQAWQIFKKRWLEIYGILLLPFVVWFATLTIMSIIPALEESFLFLLAYFIFQYFLNAAALKATLNIIRNQTIDLNEIFTWTAKYFLKFMGGMLLYTLIVIGGIILLIVPGFVWSIKYSFIPLLVIDKGVGPREAMRLSAKMTDKIKWDLLGYYFALAMIVYAGFLALLVGAVVTLPFSMIATYLLYNRLLGRLPKNSSSTS